MQFAGSQWGGARRPAPLVRPPGAPVPVHRPATAATAPMPGSPVPAAAVPPRAPPPPAGPAAPAATAASADYGAIDPALLKTLIEAGIMTGTTLASEIPKMAAAEQREKRDAARRKAAKRARKDERDDEHDHGTSMARQSGISWMHVGIGALVLLGVVGIGYALTRRPAPPVQRQEAAA